MRCDECASDSFGTYPNCHGNVTINGITYYIQRNLLTYDEAVNDCKHIFGNNKLGKIFQPTDSITTNAILGTALSFLHEDHVNPHIWLGIRVDQENVASYELNGTVFYTNWDLGEPNIASSGESILCVQAINSILGKWKAMHCTNYPAASICEVHIEKGILLTNICKYCIKSVTACFHSPVLASYQSHWTFQKMLLGKVVKLL